MSPLELLLDAAVALGEPPAAQCCVVVGGAVVHQSAHGCEADSVFDVASVTKVVATTSALASLVAAEELHLDEPAARWLPSVDPRVTLRSLLGHRSGLAAWRPLFTRVMADPIAGACFDPSGASASAAAWARARTMVLEDVLGSPLEVVGRRVYSDLGFITLGAVVEAACGQRLDRWCAQELHAGYDLGYVDLADPASSWLVGRHVLPTGHTRPREPAPGQRDSFSVPPQPRRLDAARVDDDNAFAMGGVAGHAGVFGTARAVASFVYDTWVSERLGETREQFLALDPADGPPRALGFDVPTPGSTAGALGRGRRVYGHLGFTGCSVWIDLDRDLCVALLTNRTLPGRAHVAGIRALRPAVHDAVAQMFPAP